MIDADVKEFRSGNSNFFQITKLFQISRVQNADLCVFSDGHRCATIGYLHKVPSGNFLMMMMMMMIPS